MSDPNPSARKVRIPEILKPAAARLQKLRSVWAALEASTAPQRAEKVAGAELALRRQIAKLAQLNKEPAPESVLRVEVALEKLARGLCKFAFDAPIEQLQATLPKALGERPQSLLDLLDLLTADVFESSENLGSKIGVVDYVVTLLCTEGDASHRVAPRDPVTLTAAFTQLCQRAQAECETTSLAELEAEFFTAANLANDLKDDDPLQELRARKATLGRNYFVPGMLRAVVTYNMALLQSTQSWHCDAADEVADEAGDAGSLFESTALHALHGAVRRRIEGLPSETDAVGRIAAALELGDLTSAERSTLRTGLLDPSDLHTSILMVGLLCRSLNVLGIELQEIGIDPDRFSQTWVAELDRQIKLEVNDAIKGSAGGAAYGKARELSGLRNRFLHASMTVVNRKARDGAPPPRANGESDEEREVRREARALANEAVTGEARPRAATSDESPSARIWPWQRIASAAVATAIVCTLALHLFGVIDLLQRDLDRWNKKELTTVSRHLVRGHRTGNGRGPAFVGEVGEGWLELSPLEREQAARELVVKLRRQGVAQVMIYDADEKLRIQSLGETVRVL